MRKLVKGNESSGLPSYLLCNRKKPSPGCALAQTHFMSVDKTLPLYANTVLPLLLKGPYTLNSFPLFCSGVLSALQNSWEATSREIHWSASMWLSAEHSAVVQHVSYSPACQRGTASMQLDVFWSVLWRTFAHKLPPSGIVEILIQDGCTTKQLKIRVL